MQKLGTFKKTSS